MKGLTVLYNAAIFFYTIVYKAFSCGFNAERRLAELKKEIPVVSQDLVALNAFIGEAEGNPGQFYATRIANRSEAFCQKSFDDFMAKVLYDRQITAARLDALTRELRWIKRVNRSSAATNYGDGRHLAH